MTFQHLQLDLCPASSTISSSNSLDKQLSAAAHCLPVHYPSSSADVWIRRPYASGDEPSTHPIKWENDYNDDYVGCAHVWQPSSIQLAISIAADSSTLVLYDESGVKHYNHAGKLTLDIPDVNRYEKGPLSTATMSYSLDEIYEQAWLLREHYCKTVIGIATTASILEYYNHSGDKKIHMTVDDLWNYQGGKLPTRTTRTRTKCSTTALLLLKTTSSTIATITTTMTTTARRVMRTTNIDIDIDIIVDRLGSFLWSAMTSLWSYSSPLLYSFAHWMFHACVLLPLRILIVYGGFAISCLLAWNLLCSQYSCAQELIMGDIMSSSSTIITEYHSNRPGIL
jgi:hypothetical protein